MSSDFYIQSGDILIVKGKRFSSKILSISQKFIYPKNTSSHILISVGDGFYIHSTSDRGVHFITIKELLPEIEPDFKAIRLKNINEQQYEELNKKVMFYMGQVYNKTFFIPREDRSFCSELAAKIYDISGISIIGGKSPQYVIPADFEKEANMENEWENITEQTKQKHIELLSDPVSFRVATLSFHKIMSLMALRIKGHQLIYDIFSKPELVGSNLSNTYLTEQKKLAPKLNVRTWDDIHTKYFMDDKQ